MSVLRNLESKLAGLVEGTFSRAFKSEVRPVEIARKLAKEMDEHKVQSLSRVYAPNEYAVWLSTRRPRAVRGLRGRAGAASWPATCSSTRAASGSRCMTSPQISFQHRRAPAAGRVRHPGPARAARRRREHEPPSQGDEGHTQVYSASARASGAAARARPAPRPGPPARGGRRERRRARAARCSAAAATATSSLDDANVSRRHAEVRPSGRLVDRQRPGLHQRHQGQRPPRRRRRSRSGRAT